LEIWEPGMNRLAGALGRQALPMIWEFAETNPLAGAGGDIAGTVASVSEVLEKLVGDNRGLVVQKDSASSKGGELGIYSTDPPYYDMIGYADLSDFFYVWLRRSLSKVYPDLFSTMLTPKKQELIATSHRFDGDQKQAQRFFEDGLGKVFSYMRQTQHPDYPLTIYYAFKQTETESNNEDNSSSVVTSSTGWETMLEGLIRAGFAVNGTWPMRTELISALKKNVGALASSIVLVCRPRPTSAALATRREFVAALRKELPDALIKLQHGNIAPVDLAQATIGPGMGVFSRYAKVLEADGSPMRVRTALQVINQELDAFLAAQEGEMDRDTRFCLAWFEQFGMNEGPFGEADVLARAKNTAVKALTGAGVLLTKGSKVRLLRREEYDDQWDPTTDRRITIWECTQHLIQKLNTAGEDGAARLVNRMGGGRSEEARSLAYRLFSMCERKKWAEEALAYNTLVVSWPAIQDKASQLSVMPSTQGAFQYE
jgi:putative DNA methylase